MKVLFLSALISLSLFLLFLFFSPHKSLVFSFDAIRYNNEGVSQLNEEKTYLGYKKLVKALEENPFNPVVHLNLGLAFLMNKEPAKAAKVFASAARLLEGNKELLFYSLFNGGVAAAQFGNIDMALKFYQAALDLRPNSQKVKTNIELLWKGQSGQGKDNKKNQDNQKESSKGQDQQRRDGSYEQKRQPQPFKSKELSKEDMKKILEEIKNQEQKIRAQENEKSQKERTNGKDW